MSMKLFQTCLSAVGIAWILGQSYLLSPPRHELSLAVALVILAVNTGIGFTLSVQEWQERDKGRSEPEEVEEENEY